MTGLLLTLLTTTASAGDAAAGKSVYQANCMACHGTNADGKGPAAMALQPGPTDFTSATFWAGKSGDDLKKSIRAGSPGTSMMAFSQLSDGQIDDIVAFLETKKP
ncbi:MAG: high-affinity iron transporter [Myxococcota bacterium]|jgi:high-affinity iron transporter